MRQSQTKQVSGELERLLLELRRELVEEEGETAVEPSMGTDIPHFRKLLLTISVLADNSSQAFPTHLVKRILRSNAGMVP